MMYEFTYRAKHSYAEYIVQQYLKENIDIVVAKNIREAIGSVEQIYANGVKRIESSIQQSNQILEHISFNLEGIHETLDIINSNLVSGFQQLFVKLDDINDSLNRIQSGVDELVYVNRTPIQVRADNYFEIAKDNIRRKLFREALDALDLAINGDASYPGHKTDHRYYELRGNLLAGFLGEPETVELIDLPKAEQSFLLATRYAAHDHPQMAALIFVKAGKAAYADGRFSEASRHYQSAVKFDAKCGDAEYQLAKLSLHRNNAVDAKAHFCTAIDIDWRHAETASRDLPFIANDQAVETWTRQVSRRIAGELQQKLDRLVSDLEFLVQREDAEYPVSRFDLYTKVNTEIENNRKLLTNPRLKELFEARKGFDSLRRDTNSLADRYAQYLIQRTTEISSRGIPIKTQQTSKQIIQFVAKICAAMLLVPVMINTFSGYNPDNFGPTGGSGIGIFLRGIAYFIFSLIYGLIVTIPVMIGVAVAGFFLFFVIKGISDRVYFVCDQERIQQFAENRRALQVKIDEIRARFIRLVMTN